MSEWMPIETAPRDGNSVVTFHKDWTSPLSMWWSGTGGKWMPECADLESSGDGVVRLVRGTPQPSHWLQVDPLPTT
jgi:hypothetical protein